MNFTWDTLILHTKLKNKAIFLNKIPINYILNIYLVYQEIKKLKNVEFFVVSKLFTPFFI